MTERPTASPVRTYADPRVEIYAPTESTPYYRVRGYDVLGRRIVDTTGGRTLRSAQVKAASVAKTLRRGRRVASGDPARVLVHTEAAQWLDPSNHRTRENRPWSQRHADNMAREWQLRIAPHLSPRSTVVELTDKLLWIRILNDAQSSGMAPSSVQKTGQACRSFITWLMDRGLLERNPMAGVPYSVTRADTGGLDPRAVRADEIPNLDMAFDLALWMSWLAWPQRPGRGGSRRLDVVGPQGRGIQPLLVATTGLRNAELFALRASQVDVAGLEIHVAEQLVEDDSGNRYLDRPKHGSARTVTFAAFLEHDLKEFIDHRRSTSEEDDPLLFAAPEGGWEWRRNHSRRFRAAARRAGWPQQMTWYGLRHLYAVTMLERLPLEIVSKLMGHHSPDFTAKRYLSLRVGWLDRARAASRAWEA